MDWRGVPYQSICSWYNKKELLHADYTMSREGTLFINSIDPDRESE